MSNAIVAETIGDEAPRLVSQPLQQPLEETLGSRAISPLPDQNVQDDVMLVHGTPQIMRNTADADEDLVQVRPISRPRPTPVQPSGEVSVEFCAPEPNVFVGYYDASLGEDQLDVAQAEAEHTVQPNCMTDDVRREAMPGKGDGPWVIRPAPPTARHR